MGDSYRLPVVLGQQQQQLPRSIGVATARYRTHYSLISTVAPYSEASTGGRSSGGRGLPCLGGLAGPVPWSDPAVFLCCSHWP